MKQVVQQMGQYLSQGTAPLQQRWRQLQRREQRLLQGLGLLLLVVLAWLYVLVPFQERLAQAELNVQAAQEELAWVEEQVSRIQVARAEQQEQREPLPQNELSGFINRTSGELNLEISRIQPQDDGYQLTYNEASFDQILQLLARMAEHQILIEHLDVAETNDPGLVRVRRLQIQASG